jgi:hypothetical protein
MRELETSLRLLEFAVDSAVESQSAPELNEAPPAPRVDPPASSAPSTQGSGDLEEFNAEPSGYAGPTGAWPGLLGRALHELCIWDKPGAQGDKLHAPSPAAFSARLCAAKLDCQTRPVPAAWQRLSCQPMQVGAPVLTGCVYCISCAHSARLTGLRLATGPMSAQHKAAQDRTELFQEGLQRRGPPGEARGPSDIQPPTGL